MNDKITIAARLPKLKELTDEELKDIKESFIREIKDIIGDNPRPTEDHLKSVVELAVKNVVDRYDLIFIDKPETQLDD